MKKNCFMENLKLWNDPSALKIYKKMPTDKFYFNLDTNVNKNKSNNDYRFTYSNCLLLLLHRLNGSIKSKQIIKISVFSLLCK